MMSPFLRHSRHPYQTLPTCGRTSLRLIITMITSCTRTPRFAESPLRMILFPPTVEIEEKPSAIASGFPAIRTQEEYDSAKKIYNEAIQTSCQWEDDLENKYNEDQQMDIMSMIAYWENQLRGFGKQNDERLYESIRKEDSSGKLLEEAKKGFEYAKLCLEFGPPVRKWGIKNKK